MCIRDSNVPFERFDSAWNGFEGEDPRVRAIAPKNQGVPAEVRTDVEEHVAIAENRLEKTGLILSLIHI